MKLLRYGNPGEEKPACLDAQGKIRDLSTIIPDINGNTLSEKMLHQLQQLNLQDLAVINPATRIGPCINPLGKMICIGLNYVDHAIETGASIPSEPIIFLKATSAISGAYDPIVIPHGSTHTDWEVELGVIIGKKAKRVHVDNAWEHVAGYCIVNDISERQYQLEGTTQWAKGKSCDSFGPIGPWLVTKDEIADPHQLSIWLEVDGHRYQDGNTSQMIFHIPHLVSYLSQFLTLYPGDIISTGTPAGVGHGQKPDAVYLHPGQVVTLGISNLGQQKHNTVMEKI